MEKFRRKSARKERKVKLLQLQLEEDRINYRNLQDLVDKFQRKFKYCKQQIEELEEVSGLNLGKYRKQQHELEECEERADMTEHAFARLQARNRTATVPA